MLSVVYGLLLMWLGSRAPMRKLTHMIERALNLADPWADLQEETRPTGERRVGLLKALFASAIFASLLLEGILPLALLFAGLTVAWAYLKNRGRLIKSRIERSLPEDLEALSMLMLSGYDFLSSVHVLCEHSEYSPLKREWMRVIRSVDMGVSLSEALKLFHERTRIQYIPDLSAAIEQSQSYGAGLSKNLREHAELIKNDLFQKYELRAQQAPYKMLLPLFGMIFPVTLILLVGPLVLRLSMIER